VSVTSDPSSGPAFGPVATEERIAVLDVLRGFALLGIAIMNMGYFSMPMTADALEPRLFPAPHDRAAELFMSVLFAGKANSIFALLFGIGLTIQMDRAEAKGQEFTRMYLRRLLVLFVIGMVHAVFVWDGDVLHNYAVMGLLLLALRRVSNKALFAIAACSIGVPLLHTAYSMATNAPQTPSVAELAKLAHDDMRIFQHGTYWEQVGSRLYHLKLINFDMGMRGLGDPLLYMMLTTTIVMGLYVGRERILSNIEASASRIRRITWWCLGLGFGCALVASILVLLHKPEDHVSISDFFGGVFFTLNRPLLCVAYVGVIALLLLKAGPRRFLMILAPAGSMPLTNYLMQSLIATTLFNSYGFALFGRIGPLGNLFIAIALFSLQVVYSHHWMRRFQYGPLEWLWRYASYGKAPVMRRRFEVRPAVADGESALVGEMNIEPEVS
jgi:uncharacterized protein